MESNKPDNGKILITGDGVKKFEAVKGTYVTNREFLRDIGFDTNDCTSYNLATVIYAFRIGKRRFEPHQLQRLDQLYQERCLSQEPPSIRVFESIKKMFNY